MHHHKGKGLFGQSPCVLSDPSSRDNTTAIVCISHKLGFGYHKDLKILGHYWHPRDMILFGWLKGGFSRVVCWPLLWISSLLFVVSCITHKKVRPDIFECIKVWFKTKKWPVRREMIGTDGELICFVLFNCVDMKWTQKICEYFLKKRFGNDFWNKIFSEFFEDEDHPNRILANKL